MLYFILFCRHHWTNLRAEKERQKRDGEAELRGGNFANAAETGGALGLGIQLQLDLTNLISLVRGAKFTIDIIGHGHLM